MNWKHQLDTGIKEDMSVFFIVPRSSGDQINTKMGEREKLSKYGTGWILFKFGKVLSMIGILFSLLGIAASIALIILLTRPGYNSSHSGYMSYGFIGILLVTCILLLMTCVLLWDYIGDSNLVGIIDEIIKNYCFILGGVRIMAYTIFSVNLFLFMYHDLTWHMIVIGAYLELALATWMMHGIRQSQKKALFVEAYMIYHIFVFIIIVGVLIFTLIVDMNNKR